MNPLRATRLLRQSNIKKEILNQKNKQLQKNAKLRKKELKRIREAKNKIRNEKKMKKLSTEYKLKLGRMNRDMLMKQQKQVQSDHRLKFTKPRSQKIRPRKTQKSKDVLFNSTNLSALPYTIQKKNTRSTNFSSQMKTTQRTHFGQTSRVSWVPKNVNSSHFKVSRRQDLIDMGGKGEYFEKIVDGKLKLFRKRLVPVDDLEEYGQEHEFLYDSMNLEQFEGDQNAEVIF